MNQKYFGDKRDIAKWMMLLQFGRRVRARAIRAVLFDRGDWTPGRKVSTRPARRPDSREALRGIDDDIADSVLRFFRPQLETVRKLGTGADLDLRVVKPRSGWTARNRESYVKKLVEHVRGQKSRHGETPGCRVVFLDPDTGLAPNGSDLAHVRRRELEWIWETMACGDWLVVYQHAPHKRHWEVNARKQLREWLPSPPAELISLTMPDVARDFALLCARRK